MLIIGFLIVISSIFNVQNREVWQQSQLIDHFEPVATIINSVLPEKFKVSNIDDATNAATIQSIAPINGVDEASSGTSDSVEETKPESSKN